MPLTTKIIKQLVRSWLGDVAVKVDRDKQLVKLTINGQESELTYDQVIDQVEEIFGNASSRPAKV